ncbi:MAG: hypothetical protein K2F99_05380, partial [Muribaculaceae bacterium]|nr:hypothetical protein [Muribaculaceae bacterium]
ISYYKVWAQYADHIADPKKNRKYTECCHNCACKVFNAFLSMGREEGTIKFETCEGKIPAIPEDIDRLISPEDKPKKILAPVDCMRPRRI